jgi:hypothetical protein
VPRSRFQPYRLPLLLELPPDDRIDHGAASAFEAPHPHIQAIFVELAQRLVPHRADRTS